MRSESGKVEERERKRIRVHDGAPVRAYIKRKEKLGQVRRFQVSGHAGLLMGAVVGVGMICSHLEIDFPEPLKGFYLLSEAVEG